MAEQPIAILDACVLYSSYLRDFLMRLSAEDFLFHARWSEKILSEWTESLLENKPNLSRAVLERTIAFMNIAIPDALVSLSGIELPSVPLPDENDRHVLAAAIAAKADYIVTFNLRDFPQNVCAQFDITAIHPDEFVLTLLANNVFSVQNTLARQIAGYKNPPMTPQELLEILKKLGLKGTCRVIEQ